MNRQKEGIAIRTLLTGADIKIIEMALTALVNDLDYCLKCGPFTDYAKKGMAEMKITAATTLDKISALSGYLVKMEPYNEGDEKQFINKPG